MGFQLRCPNCGNRDVYEFRFGGEVSQRPQFGAPESEWMSYVYRRRNVAGEQKEWWYHRAGCKKWFQALRDTRNNNVLQTFFFGDGEGTTQ